MTAANRIFSEKRRLIVPLAIAAAANLAALALLVYPLSRRVEGSEVRAQVASQQLAAASLDYRAARATMEGRQHTDKQLDQFYVDVLPHDQAAARRITYLKLSQLVLTISLDGDYRDIRAFIHTLETTSDFIVVRSVGLAKPHDNKKALSVALTLATYYHTDAADADERDR